MFIISLDILDFYWGYIDCSRHDPHTDRKVAAEDYLSDLPPADLCLYWWFRSNEFCTWWRRSLILCDICKYSTSLAFPNSPISFSFTAEITALRHALGWCLQHRSTCKFISLAVFTNSQSSVSLLNSASNLLAPNAVWTIWSSIAAYLIWPNFPSIGSLVTAI